jgi:hypothetical protein
MKTTRVGPESGIVQLRVAPPGSGPFRSTVAAVLVTVCGLPFVIEHNISAPAMQGTRRAVAAAQVPKNRRAEVFRIHGLVSRRRLVVVADILTLLEG